MNRSIQTICLLAIVIVAATTANAGAAVRGKYIEARTCQVYTGPCFANGETGLAGKEAVMAWNISEGLHEGVDLAGLNVIMVVSSSDTLGFRGMDESKMIKSMIVVDSKATTVQREALIDFAKRQSGKAGKNVAQVNSAPIKMHLEESELRGEVQAGKFVSLTTRKARPGDCICSNEAAYYPPLAKVENFAPGVTIDGKVRGSGLGTRWEIPDSRSAYMATFAYE